MFKKLKIFLVFIFFFNAFFLLAFSTKNTQSIKNSETGANVFVLTLRKMVASATKNIALFQQKMSVAFDKENMPENIFFLIFLAFLAGLSVSLTPCIYPLIPITVSILTSKRQLTYPKMISRLFFYLLGLLLVFASLGIIATKFNLIFGSWLSSPFVILVLVSIFVFLGFSLLDIVNFDFNYVVETPEVSSNFTAFLFGTTSAFVTSPCMTPALVSLLGFVSQQNSILLSSLLLFFFGLGMTTLIVLISIIGSSLTFLPKPGAWMNEFRKILGFWILFMAISFAAPLLSAWTKSFLQGILTMSIAFYYFFSNKTETVTKIVKAHSIKEENNSMFDLDYYFFGWKYLSFTYLLKMIVAFVAFVFGLKFLLTSYLIYRRITLIKFIKLLLKA